MMIDIHAHILPGLDDGAQDLDTALKMARIALDDGVRAMVATPHVAAGMYENSKKDILQAVKDVNEKLLAEGINLQVYPGAEYLLEPDLPRRLQAGELLTFNDNGRYLLVELPFGSVPPYMEKTFFDIMICGVTPVLAHPERYHFMQKDSRQLLALVEKGVLTQVTVGSLAGQFGVQAREAARQFLRLGCVHFLASDAHSAGHRSPVIMKLLNEVKDELDSSLIQLLTVDNPACLLKGGPVGRPKIATTQETMPQGLLTRVFSKLRGKRFV